MKISHAYVAVTNDLNQDQRMHRICNTIQDAGYQVTLIGRKKSSSEKLHKHNFEQHRMTLFFEKGVLFYLEYQIRLFFFLLFAKSPTLLYSVDLDTAMPVRLVGLLRRSKTIHDAHELFTEVPELLKSPLKRSLWKLVGKLTMNGFDHRITVNESLVRKLKKTYNCSFIAIRNLPIRKEKSKKKLEFSNPYLWYQGVLNEGRGLEELIQAMAQLPDLELRIAGEGDQSLTLRLLAEQSESKDRIHFHGWLTSDEMHDWASNAWLGTNLLNEESGNYYYSLANRTFDYIQSELPALHMDFPEYREVVKKYGVGVLVDELSADSIENVIKELTSSPAIYHEMKKACSFARSQLVWEIEAKYLLQSIL